MVCNNTKTQGQGMFVRCGEKEWGENSETYWCESCLKKQNAHLNEKIKELESQGFEILRADGDQDGRGLPDRIVIKCKEGSIGVFVPEHEQLKDFMLDQIRISKHDTSYVLQRMKEPLRRVPQGAPRGGRFCHETLTGSQPADWR